MVQSIDIRIDGLDHRYSVIFNILALLLSMVIPLFITLNTVRVLVWMTCYHSHLLYYMEKKILPPRIFWRCEKGRFFKFFFKDFVRFNKSFLKQYCFNTKNKNKKNNTQKKPHFTLPNQWKLFITFAVFSKIFKVLLKRFRVAPLFYFFDIFYQIALKSSCF